MAHKEISSARRAGERPATGERPEERASRFAGIDRKWLVLLAVGVGSFMSALDGSVTNTVLPVITKAFGSVLPTTEWVVTIYLLVVSALLLSFGRLGDMRGHKLMYMAGFAVFVLGSAACGMAPAAGWLIAFRALQALGAALIFSNSPAILTTSFPASQRGQALGIQATMTYLGLTTGPSLGGWLASQFSWRAVFYINVPIGLLALVMSMAFIKADRPAASVERFDLAGAFTFMAGLVALLLALNQGEEWGWSSLPILALLVAAVVLLGLFVATELRVAEPMLDLSLFGNRVFAASTASAICNYVCLYCVLFLLPFYLIQGRGLSAAEAGLLLTAQPLIMAIAAPIAGTLSDRIGSRLPATLGMAILTVGLFFLSRLTLASPLAYVPAGLAIAGLGTGIFISPNSSALMGAAPRNRQGIAAGVLATARNVGMVLGVGLAGAIYTTTYAHGLAAHVSDPLSPAVDASILVGTGVAALGALAAFVRGSRSKSA